VATGSQAVSVEVYDCSSPSIVLSPSTASTNVDFELGSTGAALITTLPTFADPAKPACDVVYSVATTVSAGGTASEATVALTPDSTNPNSITFEVIESSQVGKTFTVVVTGTAGA